MTAYELKSYYTALLDNKTVLVDIRIVEDYDVPEGQCFVGGYFLPRSVELGMKPIEITIAVNTADADIYETPLKSINSEFLLSVNHEFCHYEQEMEGRFLTDWDGEYLDNPNEIEAYEREGKLEFVNFL